MDSVSVCPITLLTTEEIPPSKIYHTKTKNVFYHVDALMKWIENGNLFLPHNREKISDNDYLKISILSNKKMIKLIRKNTTQGIPELYSDNFILYYNEEHNIRLYFEENGKLFTTKQKTSFRVIRPPQFSPCHVNEIYVEKIPTFGEWCQTKQNS